MGATGAGGNFAGHVQLLNSILGTKFKIVTGYDGGGSLNLAIERGEISGKANTTWAAFKTITPEWVKEGKIVPLVQFGLHKDPELPNVPLLTELATDDEQRRIFELVCSTVAIGQPFALPPGVPADRLAALRARLCEDPARSGLSLRCQQAGRPGRDDRDHRRRGGADRQADSGDSAGLGREDQARLGSEGGFGQERQRLSGAPARFTAGRGSSVSPCPDRRCMARRTARSGAPRPRARGAETNRYGRGIRRGPATTGRSAPGRQER